MKRIAVFLIAALFCCPALCGDPPKKVIDIHTSVKWNKLTFIEAAIHIIKTIAPQDGVPSPASYIEDFVLKINFDANPSAADITKLCFDTSTGIEDQEIRAKWCSDVMHDIILQYNKYLARDNPEDAEAQRINSIKTRIKVFVAGCKQVGGHIGAKLPVGLSICIKTVASLEEAIETCKKIVELSGGVLSWHDEYSMNHDWSIEKIKNQAKKENKADIRCSLWPYSDTGHISLLHWLTISEYRNDHLKELDADFVEKFKI